MTDNTWRDDAACLDTDPAAFFPEGSSNDIAAAVRVCKRCPVRSVIGCAREALDIESTERSVVGVWAGIRVSQSSTSRKVAIEELHTIAGIPYAPAENRRREGPGPCRECKREMRYRNVSIEDKPGTIRHRSEGLCDTCHANIHGTAARSTTPTSIRRRGKRHTRPEPCTGNCGRILRSSSTKLADFPGTLSDVGTWKCRPCYDRANQTVSGAA